MNWLDHSVAILAITSLIVSVMLWQRRRYTEYRWLPRITITGLTFVVAAGRTVARLTGLIEGPNVITSALFLIIMFQAVLLIWTSNYYESKNASRGYYSDD